jgi:FkbM family methyltransferase
MNILKDIKRSLKKTLLPKGLAPRRVLAGELKGFRMMLDLQEDTQVWRGVYERALQEWVRRQVQPESVCMDVGAAEGWASLLMAKYASNGAVYAFEPSTRGALIEEMFRLNGDKKLASLHVVNAFVGNPPGGGESLEGRTATPTLSIDSFFETHHLKGCDIIKIDVDGPEVDVLDGAVDVIRRYKPKMCIEIHSREAFDDVNARLATWGYTTSVTYPPRHEHRPIEFNPMIFAVV